MKTIRIERETNSSDVFGRLWTKIKRRNPVIDKENT